DVTSRKLLSLEFALPFDLRIQLRRGWPIWGDGRLRFHLQNFRLRWWRRHLSWSDRVPMNETLDAPQIARLRLGGVRRTDFTCAPCLCFSANLKEGWKKFTNSRDAPYRRASTCAAAIPSNRR